MVFLSENYEFNLVMINLIPYSKDSTLKIPIPIFPSARSNTSLRTSGLQRFIHTIKSHTICIHFDLILILNCMFLIITACFAPC